MIQYIPKSAIVSEIERRKKIVEKRLYINNSYSEEGNAAWKRDKALYDAYNSLLSSLDTIEGKEVELDDKIYYYINAHYSEGCDGGMISDANKSLGGVTYSDLTTLAKHFFELGLSASNPITATDRGTAEEIIINLKRIEKDYRINLTREIEWLRNKVQK